MNVLSTAKQNKNNPSFQEYISTMNKKKSRKYPYFVTHIEHLSTPYPRRIVDLGSCTGELLFKMHDVLEGNYEFIGCEANAEMVKRSFLNKYKKYPLSLLKKILSKLGVNAKLNIDFKQADLNNFDFGKEKVDAFTLSSLMHEIYSYGSRNKKFSIDALTEFFANMNRCLKPKGRIIIRDPIKPNNPNEMLIVKPNRYNGINPTTDQELIKTNPNLLSTAALLKRFLLQFEPAKNCFKVIKPSSTSKNSVFNNTIHKCNTEAYYELPAWLTSEFLRHRFLTKSNDEWNSEMKEQYGVFTKEEFLQFVKKIGLFPVEAVSYFGPWNRQAKYAGELDIIDQKGNNVEPNRFPTHLYACLQKETTKSNYTPHAL